jgi:hypothetical protein
MNGDILSYRTLSQIKNFLPTLFFFALYDLDFVVSERDKEYSGDQKRKPEAQGHLKFLTSEAFNLRIFLSS